MSDLSTRATAAYRKGGEAETLARQSPSYVEKSREAAEHFAEAARLTEEQQNDEEYTEEVRKVARPLALYYWAVSHKNQGWYEYETRQCEAALESLTKEASCFKQAVEEAERLIPELSDKGKEFLQPQLDSWRVYLELIPSIEFAIRGRVAWEGGRNVEAIDWYRHSVKEGQRALGMVDKISPRSNPAAGRIMRANARVTIANSLKALARNLEQQWREGKFDLYDFSRDEGLQFFGYLLEAYETAMAGAAENPEGEHITIPLKADRGNLEQFLRESVPHWGVVYARFSENKTVCALMAHINPKAYAMAKDNRVLQENKAARLWAMGSFWLFAIAVVGGVIALLGSVFSTWVVLGAIVGLEVTFLLVGAFTLRSTESLNQANFLKLVGLAARLQFRTLLAGKQAPEEPKGADEASEKSD